MFDPNLPGQPAAEEEVNNEATETTDAGEGE